MKKITALRNHLSGKNFPTHPPNHTLDFNINGEHNLNRNPSAGINPDVEDLLDFSASNEVDQMSQNPTGQNNAPNMTNLSNDQDIDTF